MELKLKNITYEYKCHNIINDITYIFEDKYIYGITGSNKTLFLEILSGNKEIEGILSANKISYKNKSNYQKAVALIRQNPEFTKKYVSQEITNIIIKTNYTNNNIQKRILDSLKLVGLNESYLNREIKTLSTSEKILIEIASKLIVNPKVLLMDDIFNKLDANNKKIIYKLIKKLKNDFNKIIIISTNDNNILYTKTDMLLILKEGVIYKEDLTEKVFKEREFLDINNIEVPYLIDFTNKVKDKGIKISYHKDILDLIKDIYKHV